jgi:hypothetical protein
VLRFKGKGAEDKEIESALRQVNALGGHVFPYCFYRGRYNVSCRSARGD